MKSGYSVIEVKTWESDGWGLPHAAGIRSNVRGEAVFVDLDEKGNVVALLQLPLPLGAWDILPGWVQGAFEAQGRKLDWKQVPSLKGQAELVGQLRPYLVSFSDPSDPASARVVAPEAFPEVFGPGVELKRIYVETTEERPSRGKLEKSLPWVNIAGKPRQAWQAIRYRGFETVGSIGTKELFIRGERE